MVDTWRVLGGGRGVGWIRFETFLEQQRAQSDTNSNARMRRGGSPRCTMHLFSKIYYIAPFYKGKDMYDDGGGETAHPHPLCAPVQLLVLDAAAATNNPRANAHPNTCTNEHHAGKGRWEWQGGGLLK